MDGQDFQDRGALEVRVGVKVEVEDLADETEVALGQVIFLSHGGTETRSEKVAVQLGGR